MIGSFPIPYPDELYYSLCARYTDRMMYQGPQAVCRDLYGDKTVVVGADLPSHLDAFVGRLPPGHCCRDIERLIYEHTLLPFYAPFLPVDRLGLVIEDMRRKAGNRAYARTGLIATCVPRPLFFRLCPACVEEDRQSFGECYWHRVHQLPGVEMCPIHGIPLDRSAVASWRSPRRAEYISAESAVTAMPLRESETSPAFHDILLGIAKDATWLLAQKSLVISHDGLARRYRTLLAEQGLASFRGIAKKQVLTESIKAFYTPELLRLLGCEINPAFKGNWLTRLTGTSRSSSHPLHCLLLTHFLGHSLPTLLEVPENPLPFGQGPWPCLNRIGGHYGEPRIDECRIEISQDSRPTGYFACPSCGLTYVRGGPDRVPEDRFRVWRYKSLGPAWEEELRKLWANPSISLSAKASRLGVGTKTLLCQVARLGLPSGTGTEEDNRTSQPSRQDQLRRPSPATLTHYREEYLAALAKNPDIGRKSLERMIPRVYHGLYFYDREWLKMHLPRRKPAFQSRTREPRPRVDWRERDELLSKEVAAAADRIRNSAGRPIRVTSRSIADEIGASVTILDKKRDKLPLTTRMLASVVETHEMLAVRKIWWAVEQYRQEGICPSRNQLMKRVSAKRMENVPLVRNAVDDAITSLRDLSSDRS